MWQFYQKEPPLVSKFIFNIPARRNFSQTHCGIPPHHHELPELHCTSNLFYILTTMAAKCLICNLEFETTNCQRLSGKTNENGSYQRRNRNCERSGFVCKTRIVTKKNRGEQFFFVNDRFIKVVCNYTPLMAAYAGLLKDGAQPIFIYLRATNTIDTTFIPLKRKSSLIDEPALYAILRASIHSQGNLMLLQFF
jgi:DNA mismatch repair protein MutL